MLKRSDDFAWLFLNLTRFKYVFLEVFVFADFMSVDVIVDNDFNNEFDVLEDVFFDTFLVNKLFMQLNTSAV